MRHRRCLTRATPAAARLCKALPERLPTIRRRQDLRVDHRTTESQPDGSTKSTPLSLPDRPSTLEEEGLILSLSFSLPLPLFPPLYSVWLAQLAWIQHVAVQLIINWNTIKVGKVSDQWSMSRFGTSWRAVWGGFEWVCVVGGLVYPKLSITYRHLAIRAFPIITHYQRGWECCNGRVTWLTWAWFVRLKAGIKEAERRHQQRICSVLPQDSHHPSGTKKKEKKVHCFWSILREWFSSASKITSQPPCHRTDPQISSLSLWASWEQELFHHVRLSNTLCHLLCTTAVTDMWHDPAHVNEWLKGKLVWK